MKTSNTSNRLNEYMVSKNLRQVDLLRLAEPYCKIYGVKLNKSDLSQYVSGKVEPGQDKLFILAKALNVTESWLMGYDDNSNTKPIPLYFDTSGAKTLEELTPEDIAEALRILPKSLKDFAKSLENLKETVLEAHADNVEALIYYYNKLNHEGHKEILKRTIELSKIDKYRAESQDDTQYAYKVARSFNDKSKPKVVEVDESKYINAPENDIDM